ncbi:MAG: cupin domain-containing protein [Candidatus Dormibacteraceae bacterium]
MSGDYFQRGTPGGRPQKPARWVDTATGVSPIELLPGLVFRPVVGTNLALNVVRFEPHTEAPLHAHREEQITFVLEGELEFEVDGEVRALRPGMAVEIPPHAMHGARTGAGTCLEIDVFSPPRQGLLDAMARLAQAGEVEGA